MGTEIGLIARSPPTRIPCVRRFLIRALVPIIGLSLSCRVSAPDGMPDGYDGAVGDHPPLVHQQIGVGGDDSAGRTTDDTAPVDSTAPVVVVLVTDGARIDETLGEGVSSVTGEPTAVFLPTIRSELLPRGAVVTRAHNTGVTITAEGHGELVTGRRIPHANFPTNAGAGDFRPTIPTLFEVLRRTDGAPQLSAVVGGNSGHLQGLTQSHHPRGGGDFAAEYLFVGSPDDPSQAAGDDEVVIDAVRAWMEENPTRLIVANLHQMDRSGHFHASPLAYATRVKAVDGPIVAFWNWIQAHEDYQDRTTLIVLADHGRHRLGTAEDHRHHGDACGGCRQIPLFLIGPGIRPGIRTDSVATLGDVGATIAEILNLDLPHATGRVLSEVLLDPPARDHPEGESDPILVEEHQLSRVWLDDAAQRSTIVLDGLSLSTEGATHAEGPTLVARGGLVVACWRELFLGMDEIDVWSWEPRCRRTTTEGDWVDFRFPVSPVSPYFRPALAIDQAGQLWSAFTDNPTGNWEANEQRVRVHRWTASRSWEEAGAGADQVRFAMHPALVPVAGGTLVAFVTSDTAPDPGDGSAPTDKVHERARYRRHIQLHHIAWPPFGSPSWSARWRSYTADHYEPDAPLPAPVGAWEGWAEIGRMDRPALGQSAHAVHLVFLAMGHEGGPTTLRYLASSDEGMSWTEPTLVDAEDVAPHITPVISEGAVYWARSADDGVSICRWVPGGTPACTATGAEAIDGLSLSGTTWAAGLRIDGVWQVRTEAW